MHSQSNLTGNRSLTLCPYFIIKYGIGINNTPAPASIVHPHPYPIAEYIPSPNRGNTAPTKDRNNAPAAIADAAYRVKASI
jgi:hypothetical protein